MLDENATDVEAEGNVCVPTHEPAGTQFWGEMSLIQ